MTFSYWTNFSKRKNSTKIPSGAASTATCVLKEDTSIMEPVIILQGHSYFNLNYAYISDFGRYYFVTDIRTKGPDTEISLTCDVLATYKAAITGSSQYVERAATGTQKITADPLNPPTDRVLRKNTLIATYTDDIIDYSGVLGYLNSHYILGVVGKTGVDYWGLTWSELQNFFDKVFSLSFLQQFTSAFYDYRDCVLSLKRVTYVPTGDPGQTIYLGEHAVTGATGTALNSAPIVHDSGLKTVAFPADDYLNIRTYPYYPPYTTGSLYLPMVGLVPLDVSAIAGDGKLGVKAYVDKFTADIVYKVYTTNDIIIGSYYGNCGADLPIAAQNYNATGIVGGAVQLIGGIAAAFSGGGAAAVGLGAGSAGAGVAQVAESVKLHTQVNGSISSFIGGNISQAVYATIYTNEPLSWNVANMNSTQGVIIGEQKAISGHSGYLQCRNAHVSITGSDKERDLIESLMNSGIFIE